MSEAERPERDRNKVFSAWQVVVTAMGPPAPWLWDQKLS